MEMADTDQSSGHNLRSGICIIGFGKYLGLMKDMNVAEFFSGHKRMEKVINKKDWRGH